MPTKLIVGLGNPGDEMYHTRHNIGFRCTDYISEKLKIPFKIEKKKSVYGKKKINGTEVIVLKPQTFINLSGEAVLYIASFLKVDIDNIYVIFDDINRKIGQVAIENDLTKLSHNAISHLCESLRQDDFIKCAVGVGPLPKNSSEEEFYLTNFTSKEEAIIKSEEIYEKSFRLALSALNIAYD